MSPAPSHPSRAHGRFSAARIRGELSNPGVIIAASVLVLGVGALIAWLASTDFSWAEISRVIAGFNPVLAIALMAFLPMVGFSISIVYIAVGAKFGPLLGLPVVIGVTAFHLLATYWITRSFLRRPIGQCLQRRGYTLPTFEPGERVGICLLGALVPGLPYFARNCLLALTEVPLRIYFWICLPVYVARSYVAILIGDLTANPDGSQLMILLGVYAVKLGICAYVVWRLRRKRRVAHHH